MLEVKYLISLFLHSFLFVFFASVVILFFLPSCFPMVLIYCGVSSVTYLVFWLFRHLIVYYSVSFLFDIYVAVAVFFVTIMSFVIHVYRCFLCSSGICMILCHLCMSVLFMLCCPFFSFLFLLFVPSSFLSLLLLFVSLFVFLFVCFA